MLSCGIKDLLFAMLLCSVGVWADPVTISGTKQTWTTATSVTVGSSALDASNLTAGKKIVFARKSNSSKYLTVSSSDQICGASGYTGSFGDATANSVFKVGGSDGAWTFESAHQGYFFPSLTNSNWEARYTSTTATTFSFTATGDGDNSYFIKSNAGGKWFDGGNDNFTAWEGSGDNAKYYIYEAELVGEGTNVTTAALGNLSSGQYTYESESQTGAALLNTIRLTFKATNTNNKCGDYPFVHFAEFYLYDANGTQIDLTKYPSSIFSSNATSTDEGSLAALNNGVTTGASNVYDWYWHSAWRNGPSDYHYLEINVSAIDADLTTFQFGYITRNTNCIPTEIDLTTTYSDFDAYKAEIAADADYIAAKAAVTTKDVYGYPSYAVTSALTSALEGTSGSALKTAYANFKKPANIVYPAVNNYYRLTCIGQTAYANNAGTGLNGKSDSDVTTIFYLEDADNGNYYIKADNGLYAQSTTQSAQVMLGTTKVAHTLTAPYPGKLAIRATGQTGDYQFWHRNGGNVVGWRTWGDTSDAPNNNTLWTIAAVEDYTIFPVTFADGTYAGASLTVGTTGYTGSTTLYDGAFYALKTGTPTAADFSATSGAQTATVTVNELTGAISASFASSETVPSFITFSTDETNAYYYIHCANSGSTGHYIKALYDDKLGQTTTKAENGAGVFQFYEAGIGSNGFKQYYIYNVGAQAWVSYSETSAGSPRQPLVTDKSQCKTWRLLVEEGGNSMDIIPGELTTSDGSTQSWNMYNGFGETYLGLWNSSGGDSSWTVEEAELDADALAALKSSFASYYVSANYSETKGQAGYMNDAFYTTLSNCADVTTLKSTFAARTIDNIVKPSNGKFYTFVNNSKYITAPATTGTMFTVADVSSANSIFYYDSENHLLVYGTGYYANGKNHAVLGNKDTYTFTLGNSYGTLQIKPSANNPWYNNNGTLDFNSGIVAGNSWTVTEVTELPLTISAAGYATFSAPVETTAPEGTTAYYVSAAGTTATLTPYTNNIIPANQGAILYHEGEANVSLTISNTSASVEGNKLVANVAASVLSGDDKYILANKNSQVGFYKFKETTTSETNPSTSTNYTEAEAKAKNTLGGHKCYLAGVSAGGVKEFLGFNFDGETGINNANVNLIENRDGKYLENGKIMIIKNGKKYNVAGQMVK